MEDNQQKSRSEHVHTPGDDNPALGETEAYEEGKISTAEFLDARETGEAQLSDEPEDRDAGLDFRPTLHDAHALPINEDDPEEEIYDKEELHVLEEEPETDIFPQMRNISSDD